MRITPLQRTIGAGILVKEGRWSAPLAAERPCSADTDRRSAMSRRMRVVAFAAILATGSSCGCGS